MNKSPRWDRPLQRILPSVLLFLAFTSCSSAGVITNRELKFRITIPDGFEETASRTRPDQIYVFQRPRTDQPIVGTTIVVERLRGILRPGKPDVAKPDQAFTWTTGRWKELELDFVRQQTEVQDVRIVALGCQIPLVPEAIQIFVAGDADREDEVRQSLLDTLASVDGQSNWLTADQRQKKLFEGIAGTVTVVVLGLYLLEVSRENAKKVRQAKLQNESGQQNVGDSTAPAGDPDSSAETTREGP